MTKLDFDQYTELISAGKSHVTAHLEAQLRKGPRHQVHSVGETSKIEICSSTYNPKDGLNKGQKWYGFNRSRRY